jgi:hypothetical protein
MNLLIYEFKKNAFKPYVILLVLVCTLVNLIGIYLSCGTFRPASDWEGFEKLYESKLKGEFTEDKINFVISETDRLTAIAREHNASTEINPDTYTGVNVYADSFLFMFDIYPPMKYAVSYSFDNNRIVENAKDNIDFFTGKNNTYEVRKNEQIQSLYHDRDIKNFYDLRAMERLVVYDFSSLIILLLCVLVIVPVFVTEKETRMDQLLPSFKKGGLKLVWTKILFSFTVVFLISLWFSLWDLIGFALFSPLRGFDAPLYALEAFQFTPLNLKIYQYFLLVFVCKTIGFGTLVSLVLLASKAFSKTIYAFLVSTSVILIPYLSQFFARDSFRISELINPALLIKARNFFMRFSVQNIFGYPVSSPAVALAVNVIITVIVISLVVLSAKNIRLFKKEYRVK